MVVGELIPKNIVIARPERGGAPRWPARCRCSRVAVRPAHPAGSTAPPTGSCAGSASSPRRSWPRCARSRSSSSLFRSSGEEGTLAGDRVTLLTRSHPLRREDRGRRRWCPGCDGRGARPDDTVADLVRAGRRHRPLAGSPCAAPTSTTSSGVVHVKDVLPAAVRRPGRPPRSTAHDRGRRRARDPRPRVAAGRPPGRRRPPRGRGRRVRRHRRDHHARGPARGDRRRDRRRVRPATPCRVDRGGAGTWVLPGTLHPDEVLDACGFGCPRASTRRWPASCSTGSATSRRRARRSSDDGWTLRGGRAWTAAASPPSSRRVDPRPPTAARRPEPSRRGGARDRSVRRPRVAAPAGQRLLRGRRVRAHRLAPHQARSRWPRRASRRRPDRARRRSATCRCSWPAPSSASRWRRWASASWPSPPIGQLHRVGPRSRSACPTGRRAIVGFVLALTIVVFLHMVIGEMVPKNLALAGPERTLLVAGLAATGVYVTLFRPGHPRPQRAWPTPASGCSASSRRTSSRPPHSAEELAAHAGRLPRRGADRGVRARAAHRRARLRRPGSRRR